MKRGIRRLLALVLALLMAAALAAPGLATGDGYEPEWSLTTLDGDIITQDSYKNKVQLLVFFDGTISGTDAECYYSAKLFEDLADAAWTSNEDIQIIAIEANGNTLDATASFWTQFASGCDDVVFAYGGQYDLFQFLGNCGLNGGTWCFCAIVEDGVLVDFWDACSEADDAAEHLSEFVDLGLAPRALVTVPVYGKFYQTEARSMLDLINAFRTGGEAWIWNSDDVTQTTYPAGTLQALTYDYTLEQIAMQRAAELVVRFQTDNYIEHQRPNGGDCFSLSIDGVSSSGENIAWGQQSAAQAYMAWREDDYPYDGQGHRRNMLRVGFNAVGIACFEYNGSKYWVQEFGESNSGAAATAADDSGRQVPVEYDANEFPDFKPISAPAPSGGGGGSSGGGGTKPAPVDGQDQSLPQLAVPTDLMWGMNRMGTDSSKFYALPGAASWKFAQPASNKFDFRIFRVTDSGDEEVFKTSWSVGSNEGYFTSQHFLVLQDQFPSGKYYFTVQMIGDGVTYRNSDIACSGLWTYTVPTKQLGAPTMVWSDDAKLVLTAPTEGPVWGYAYRIYIKDATAAGDAYAPAGWRACGGGYSWGAISDYNGNILQINKYTVEQFGAGEYAFAVSAITGDPNQVRTGSYALSPSHRFGEDDPSGGGGGGDDPSGGGGGGGGGTTPAPDDGQDQTLPQLATPTELTWGKYWKGQTYDSIPGMASWKYTQPHQGQFHIVFYRIESDGDKEVTRTTWHLGSTESSAYFSSPQFIENDYPSGKYYFTLQAMADGTQYRNSDIARSETWQFTAPSAKFPVPTDLGWTEDGMMTVAQPDSPYAWGTSMGIYVRDENAKGSNGIPDGWKYVGGTTGISFTKAIYDGALQRGGSGYYAFRVRYLSGNVTQIRTGDWSELSTPRWFGDGSPDDNPLDDALADIEKLDQNASAAEKQAAVETAEAALRETGTQAIKENLLTDNEGSGTTQKLIEKAEELKGNKAEPRAATEGLDAEAQQQLNEMAQGTEIVGAGLNTDADQVELRIGKPDPDAGLVVPAQYANTVEIKLDLYANGENITADHQELDVPVKITMPVPAGINPAFLVILHHKADGSISEVFHPYIFRGTDGKYYATFVISSFSDFTFAEAQVTAKLSATGVDVTVSVPAEATAATASVVCAAYDANGKMLGSGVGQYTGSTLNLSITCAPAKVATVKVFFLGSGSAPVVASIPVEPE